MEIEEGKGKKIRGGEKEKEDESKRDSSAREDYELTKSFLALLGDLWCVCVLLENDVGELAMKRNEGD